MRASILSFPSSLLEQLQNLGDRSGLVTQRYPRNDNKSTRPGSLLVAAASTFRPAKLVKHARVPRIYTSPTQGGGGGGVPIYTYPLTHAHTNIYRPIPVARGAQTSAFTLVYRHAGGGRAALFDMKTFAEEVDAILSTVWQSN